MDTEPHKWQAILLGIASSWRLARPLPEGARWPGSRFYSERLWFFFGGALGALAVWVTEWACAYFIPWYPWWLTSLRLATDNLFRATRVQRVLDNHDSSDGWYFMNWTLWLTWLLVTHMIFSVDMRLTADIGLARFVLGAAFAWIQYVHDDNPPGRLKVNWICQKDHMIGYFLTVWLLHDGTRIFSWVKWIAFRVVDNLVMELVYQTRMYGISVLFETLLPNGMREIAEWVLLPGLIVVPMLFYVVKSKVSVATMQVALQAHPWLAYLKTLLIKLAGFWDWFEHMEVMLYEVPMALQKDFCLQEQNARSGTDMAHYEYSSLQPGEVRLLKLPKTNKCVPGTINAQLLHQSLAGCAAYEALSYRWGSSERTHEILVDGKRFAVTQSAFDLLLARRSFWHERLVWIDAICINQTDEEEKSKQVQMMHDIYQAATRVILFPLAGYETRLAAGVLYELGLSAGGAVTYQGFELRGLNPPLTPPFKEPAPRWKALVDLLCQEYFCRSWIVQEVVSGREVQLYLCGHYVSWSTLYDATLRLMDAETLHLLTLVRRMEKPGVQDPRLHVMNILYLDAMRNKSDDTGFRGHEELSRLETILYMTNDFRASDPRDKIFAILGIANQPSSPGLTATDNDSIPLLRADYTKSLNQVLFETTRFTLLGQQACPIDVLALAGFGWPKTVHGPSWMINFDNRRNASLFSSTAFKQSRFHAGSHLSASVRRGANPWNISVHGLLCDSILAISEFVVNDSCNIRPKDMLDFVDAAANLIDACASHLSPQADFGLALTSASAQEQAKGDVGHWRQATRDFISLTERDDLSNEAMRKSMAELYARLLSQTGMGPFRMAMHESCAGRHFGITTAGQLCLIPPLSAVGDSVWIPCGAQTPYIVRKKQGYRNESRHVLMGEAYVQGIMDGEAMWNDAQLEFLNLV